MKYTLVSDTIRNADIDALCDWLKTYPRLSKGELTPQFEKRWAEWLGMKHAVYVNSGSSANLLILSCLIEGGYIKPGSKVVVPAVSWATDLAPVMQLGLEPILCDCNLVDLSLDLDEFERICKEEKPAAVMFVSVLGIVPDMERVVQICKQNKVHLIEDTCESFGSKYKDQLLGSFGKASTFSLYFGHHLSTIEGGIVATNDNRLYNILLSMRSHGWMRDCSADFGQWEEDQWHIEPLNRLYTFYYPGYNLRSTDLQAFLGLRQLNYADDVNNRREENFQHYLELLSDSLWKPESAPESFVSNFCYPIICENRRELHDALAENEIETRPLIAGSMAFQPFFMKKYGEVEMPNAAVVHEQGLYVPNNHNLTREEIEVITSVINKVAR